MTKSPYLEHTVLLFFKLKLLKIHQICVAKYMFQIKNLMTSHDNQTFRLAIYIHKHHTRLSSESNHFITNSTAKMQLKILERTFRLTSGAIVSAKSLRYAGT